MKYVEIRKASRYSKKYIVWDTDINQIFANEKFDSVEEASQFIKDNGLKNTLDGFFNPIN